MKVNDQPIIRIARGTWSSSKLLSFFQSVLFTISSSDSLVTVPGDAVILVTPTSGDAVNHFSFPCKWNLIRRLQVYHFSRRTHACRLIEQSFWSLSVYCTGKHPASYGNHLTTSSPHSVTSLAEAFNTGDPPTPIAPYEPIA